MTGKRFLIGIAVAAGIGLSAGQASATAIMIPNYSFEVPVKGSGGYCEGTGTGSTQCGTAATTDWTFAATNGVFNPITTGGSANFNAPTPDGSQVGFLNAGTIGQTLTGNTYVAGDTYTLTVYVGNRADADFAVGLTVELLGTANSVVYSDAATIPEEGKWEQETFTFTANAGIAGQTIGIGFVDGAGGQTDIDDVTLDAAAPAAAPATGVPEPGSLAILGAALAGFGIIRRRRVRL